MKLCTFLKQGESESRVGAVIAGERVLDLSSWLATSGAIRMQERILTLYDLLQAGDRLLDALSGATEKIRSSEAKPFMSGFGSIRLLAPLPRPAKILAAIVNTQGMLGGKDVKLDHPRLDQKAPSTVIGPGETILAPTNGIRPEIELAAVIGKRVSKNSAREARQAIFGYTILNDVTSPNDSKEDAYEAYRRDPITGVLRKTRVRGPLFRSKNHDTFTPMGPWVVTSDELAKRDSLRMLTRFNGKVVQEGNTSEYIFGPEEVVSYASRFLTLEPGDVVSFGSIGWKQASKAVDPSEWVLNKREGVLRLEIEGMGILENPVKRERRG